MKDKSAEKNSAYYYSVNMLRMLLSMELITKDEYEKIVGISAEYYDIDRIYS